MSEWQPFDAAKDAQIRTLRNALLAAKIPHYVCEDCWYSCGKTGVDCCNDAARGKCTCGADAHNAKIDEALNV